jgi:hypothetical protein
VNKFSKKCQCSKKEFSKNEFNKEYTIYGFFPIGIVSRMSSTINISTVRTSLVETISAARTSLEGTISAIRTNSLRNISTVKTSSEFSKKLQYSKNMVR